MEYSSDLSFNHILDRLGTYLIAPLHARVAYVFGVGLADLLEQSLFPDSRPFGADTLIAGGLSGKLTVAEHLGAQSSVDGGPCVFQVMSEHIRRQIRSGLYVDSLRFQTLEACRDQSGEKYNPFHISNLMIKSYLCLIRFK